MNILWKAFEVLILSLSSNPSGVDMHIIWDTMILTFLPPSDLVTHALQWACAFALPQVFPIHMTAHVNLCDNCLPPTISSLLWLQYSDPGYFANKIYVLFIIAHHNSYGIIASTKVMTSEYQDFVFTFDSPGSEDVIVEDHPGEFWFKYSPYVEWSALTFLPTTVCFSKAMLLLK